MGSQTLVWDPVFKRILLGLTSLYEIKKIPFINWSSFCFYHWEVQSGMFAEHNEQDQ